jgi:hypothetical protein
MNSVPNAHAPSIHSTLRLRDRTLRAGDVACGDFIRGMPLSLHTVNELARGGPGEASICPRLAAILPGSPTRWITTSVSLP